MSSYITLFTSPPAQDQVFFIRYLLLLNPFFTTHTSTTFSALRLFTMPHHADMGAGAVVLKKQPKRVASDAHHRCPMGSTWIPDSARARVGPRVRIIGVTPKIREAKQAAWPFN